MRVVFPRSEDQNLNKIIRLLNIFFERIGKSNLNFKELSGTTDGVADTAQLLKHGMTPRPRCWLPVEGDVYVPKYGITNTTIDVRSRNASEDFVILLIGD
jgi:hypothetical protein